ncbi:hypothetical protein HS088_TW14G01213 [Tripterygium wilfordii]|uniref:N-acetyltransferase domain-containing protein n=1 Tax=Tripterygium wilfordii TaxID=458696 RepID=A0A7J7CSH1_TRIWF|nr:probable N-acetyltransferase HLS1 [Tripterygium wilfordii]KAF5737057.1 hypothetical protein HS088_TW14G01213 [Tripterygium wilfordii]
MVDNIQNKVIIREYNEDRDIQVVGKLERNCDILASNFNKELSIFTNIVGNPLCRIRFYPSHVVLVAEVEEIGELVGVVRGCIKCVGTKQRENYVNLGCILGLRVSPRYRRMGIGLRLVKSIEEWLIKKGANYTFTATEKSNVASTNLFTIKCNYTSFGSLVIFVQPVGVNMKGLPQTMKLKKLKVEQAIHLYKDKFKAKDIYPADIDEILKDELSLGTWVSYFKEEEEEKWINEDNIITETPGSWAMFSIWNSCEAYKLQYLRKPHPFKFLLSQAREIIFSCLKLPMCDSLEEPFGFLFLYGIFGEGERLQELMECMWNFASGLAKTVKDCKVIITELGLSDPLMEHFPQESFISCINDLWYLKKVIEQDAVNDDDDQLGLLGQAGDVFVDPRDF